MIERWWNQRNTPASHEVNLLDFPKPARNMRRAGYWMILGTLFLLHGGVLFYLVAFPWLSREADGDGMRPIIRVEFVNSISTKALSKEDKENIRAAGIKRLPDSQKKPTQSYAEVVGSTRPPVQALSVSVGILPEDHAIHPITQSISHEPPKTTAESKHHTSLFLTFERHIAAGYQAVLPPVSLKSPRLVKADKRIWPEDTGYAPLNFESTRQVQQTVQKDNVLPSQAKLFKEERTVLLSLPPKRALVADEIARHASSRSRDDNPVAKPSLERKKYESRVRAHLKLHRPNGGFGTGLVIVAFKLSRSGDVVSARILRSSGNDDLDDNALRAIHRSAPYPKPPSGLKISSFHFTIPFRFE